MQIKHLFSVLLLATAFSVGTMVAMDNQEVQDTTSNLIASNALDEQNGDAKKSNEDVQSNDSGDVNDGEDDDLSDAKNTADQSVKTDSDKKASCAKCCSLLGNWKRKTVLAAVAALIGYGYWKVKGQKNGKKFAVAA